MSKRAKHASCSVVGCTEPRASLHRTPAAEDVSSKWIDFIYHGNVPATVGKGHLYVCGNHFLPDCFANLGPYNAGLADKLFLKVGSVPTVAGKTTDEGNVSIIMLCVSLAVQQ